MSPVMNLVSGVDMTLLSRNLVVVKLVVSVEVMSGHSSILTPGVTCTRCVSALLWQSEATSLQYKILLSAGTADCLIKKIVFVPLFIRVPTLYASQPRSLARAVVHVFLVGPRMRCLYSRTVPAEGSITELQRNIACGRVGVLAITQLAYCTGL